MNQLNNQEEEFKKVLEGISFEVDTSAVWCDIKGQLPLKKEKDRKPFWLFFGIFAAAMIGLSMVLISNQGNDVRSTTHVINNLESKNELKVSETESGTYSDKSAGNNIEVKEVKRSQENSELNNNEIHTIKEQVNSLKRNNKSTAQLSNNSISYQKGSLNNNDLSSNAITSKSDYTERAIQKITADIVSNTNKVNADSNSFSIASISNMIYMISMERKKPLLNMDFNNRITPLVSIETKTQFFINLRVGSVFGISDNSLIDTNSEFDANKFSNEVGRFGISADLIAGVETAKGWKFFGGLNHSNEVYNYSNQSVEDTSFEEVGVVSQHIDADGITNDINGAVTVNSTTAYDLSWHRRHQSLALSVGVAKRMQLYKGFSVQPEVSLLYSLLQNDSGYYFSEDSGDITKFSQGDINPYSQSNVLRYRLGIGFNYDLKNISIGIVSAYIYNPNNYLSESTFYQSKSDLISTQLSVNFYPNW